MESPFGGRKRGRRVSEYTSAVALRRIALLTLLAFGCATVRVPVTASEEPGDGAGVVAPPIVELWIESSDQVPPGLAAGPEARTRSALNAALAERDIRSDAAGATDAVLFVRERAVAVTEARHSQQTWAKVGIVVGIVVVVAAVVILAVSGSKGSSSKAPKTTVPKAAPVAVKPRAIPVPSPPKGLPTVARAVPLPRYYGYRRSPIFVGFYFDFWIPPRPLVLAPEAVEEPWYAPEPPPPLATESAGESAMPAPPPPEPEPIPAVALPRPPVRDGPQGPPLRAGGRPDPAAELRRHAQARRPAPAGAGAGGEARRRTQLRPRRSPHSGGDGHPRAEAGPWHRGPRSVDRLAGGPARQRPHAQARDGGRAAGRAPDHRAGAGGARRAQRDRRGDRGAGGDPSPPGAEDASRRAGHRGGLAVPLRAGARGPQQRPAESARRADGSLAREPRPLVAGPRPARALVRRPPAHPAGDQAPRRQGGGEGSEPALERDRGSPDASALTEVEMDRLFAVEIVYRGIFQKKLAANISRAIVLAAHKEGKPGISFGRYGDSPERNGIPAKYFAIVATDETTLEEGKAKYEPKEVDISICVDDTLLQGVESWAWYGLQPINKLLKPGGTLIVTSLKEAGQLIPLAHRKATPYKLAVLKGTTSFSGLWGYKYEHTDVSILSAM